MGLLNYHFDWSVLWRAPYGQMMIQGIFTTVHLSLIAWGLALVLGILIGVLRTQPWLPGRIFGAAYVQIFRNTPFLVHLFFWYYAAPLILPESGQQWLYDSVPNYAYWAGVAGLGMYTASRVAEQFRSGFSSIPADQYRAAYASGLRTFQVYRWVIIPYGFRLILPTITTEFLTCFKNSALTMTIGVMEITHTAYYIDSFTWHGLETTTAASLVYLTIAWTVIAVMGQVEKRVYIPGQIRKAG
ncbi:MAG: amino acid ABC transporter permease [Desulfotignum sp.]|nr:amino acid ABC transporter permease [Desulfotignum sp.]